MLLTCGVIFDQTSTICLRKTIAVGLLHMIGILQSTRSNHLMIHMQVCPVRLTMIIWNRWTIYLLYKYTSLVKKIHVTPVSEIEYARKRVIELTRQKPASNDNSLSEFPSFEDLIRHDHVQGSKNQLPDTDTTCDCDMRVY